MNPKETGSKLLKHAKDMKEQAQKLGKEAAQTAGTVKNAVKAGVDASKNAAQKVLNPDTIAKGLGATSKGAKIAADTARIASKGVERLAKTLDTASKKVGQLNDKFKKK